MLEQYEDIVAIMRMLDAVIVCRAEPPATYLFSGTKGVLGEISSREVVFDMERAGLICLNPDDIENRDSKGAYTMLVRKDK